MPVTMLLRALVALGLGVLACSCRNQGGPEKAGATAQSATPNVVASVPSQDSRGQAAGSSASPLVSGAEAQERAAIAAAELWLKLVDEGRYGDSYAGASAYFKKQGTLEGWIELAKKSRTPLGKVRSRTLKSKKLRTSVPGGPDGLYVTLRFETDFENKVRVVETLAPVLEPDGTWRVSGYYTDADIGQNRRP